MAVVSVAQAAERLGVSVPRIHQRIADGSLVAERVGSQWVVDEQSLLRVQERNRAGRPYSARSAWAIIAASQSGPDQAAAHCATPLAAADAAEAAGAAPSAVSLASTSWRYSTAASMLA